MAFAFHQHIQSTTTRKNTNNTTKVTQTSFHKHHSRSTTKTKTYKPPFQNIHDLWFKSPPQALETASRAYIEILKTILPQKSGRNTQPASYSVGFVFCIFTIRSESCAILLTSFLCWPAPDRRRLDSGRRRLDLRPAPVVAGGGPSQAGAGFMISRR